MNILYFLHKTFLENLREWKILIMVLSLSPFFVLLMWGYFSAASPIYRLSVINDDADDANGPAEGLIQAWQNTRHPDGNPVFEVETVPDADEASKRIENKSTDLAVHIPKGFGAALRAVRENDSAEPPLIANMADPSNPRSNTAMAFSDYIAFGFAFDASKTKPPLGATVIAVGSKEALSEFDVYIPALLVLAVIMVLFTSAASFIREVEQGTMMRLLLSRVSPFQMTVAVSINQVIIGLVSLGLALLAAYMTGYRPSGSVLRILPVGAVAVLGVTAVGIMCAAFLKNMFALLTVGVFPFFILMFFSECMFPLPKIPLFDVLGNTLYANDVLPTSLAVRAMGRILNHGATLGDVGFELAALILLTTVYFAVAVLVFNKRNA